MQLSIYDILSKIIPGALLIILLKVLSIINLESLSDVLILFIFYIIGYLIEIVSSIFEPTLFWSYGGIPSKNLMLGKKFSRIRLYQISALNEFLKINYPDYLADKQASFRIIYNQVIKTEIPRVRNFLEAYSFSRNLFFTYLIGLPFFLAKDHTLISILSCLIIGFLFWYRSKQRAYYFSKEVIETFIRDNNIK